jgi:Ni/Co efflux regulator RcnB
MFKRFGLATLLLAGLTIFQPATAFADDHHRHDGGYRRGFDRHDDRDWRRDRHREQHFRREQERREREWRRHEFRRWQRWNYRNGYYGRRSYYAPQSGLYFSWEN